MDFTTYPYLSLETYRKQGKVMRTPVWFVRNGERLYIRMIAESGKVKRLRCTPRLRVALCDRVGNVTGPLGRSDQARGLSRPSPRRPHRSTPGRKVWRNQASTGSPGDDGGDSPHHPGDSIR